jgi:transposase
MAFEKICIVKGKKYKSLVEGYRDSEGRVKHRFIKYIGAVEPLNKKRKNPNAGRKPALVVRVMNSEETKIIARALKDNKSFAKDRAKIIQLSKDGNTVKQICERLKFDKKKVGKIINQFNSAGIKIFERKKGTGRPRRISDNERARVIESLNTNPKKLGLHFNNWSRNRLSDYLKNNGIKISPSYVGEIIKTDEIRYKKKRSKMYSNDKNFLRNILR